MDGRQGERPGERLQLDLDRSSHRRTRSWPRTAAKSPTPLTSLQVGLSTLNSYTEDLPPAHSRSISWKDAATPLYKIISPQSVFDALVAGGLPQTGNATDVEAMRRAALQKSALDYIAESTTRVRMRLSNPDVARLDQFLTSVRDLETRIAAARLMPPSGLSCNPLMRPSQTVVDNQPYPPGFDRGMHATLMIDLVVMAFQCDTTRVVSFMLDDARSDYVYGFIPMRKFSMTGLDARHRGGGRLLRVDARRRPE